jgi:hypothetical protein
MQPIENNAQYERYTFLEDTITNFLSDVNSGYCVEFGFSAQTIKDLENAESELFNARRTYDLKRVEQLKKK